MTFVLTGRMKVGFDSTNFVLFKRSLSLFQMRAFLEKDYNIVKCSSKEHTNNFFYISLFYVIDRFNRGSRGLRRRLLYRSMIGFRTCVVALLKTLFSSNHILLIVMCLKIDVSLATLVN